MVGIEKNYVNIKELRNVTVTIKKEGENVGNKNTDLRYAGTMNH